MDTKIVTASGVQLAVRTWGDAHRADPLLLLVHGFPDNSLVWQPVARQLAARFRVAAYDVRGAGQSDAPETTSAYKLPILVDDLAAVIDALSPEQPVHLVGHDWGSIQCWEAVTTPRLRNRIASFTSISGPSLDHAAYWIRNGLRQGTFDDRRKIVNQLLHSWYIAAFHLPLAQRLTWRIAFNKWPSLLAPLPGLAPESFPSQGHDGFNGVRLYRANFIDRLLKPGRRETDIPVQLIIPTRDRFVTPGLFDYLDRWAGRVWRRELDAEHWVQLSHPGEVAALVRDFVDLIDAGDLPG